MTNIPQKLKDLPLWHGAITAEPLTGGLSNESYVVTDQTGKYIARFCQDIPVHHVNRDHEAMVSFAAAKAGYAPALVNYSPGIMVFQFIEAKTYTNEDIRSNLKSLANLIKGFHNDISDSIEGPGRIFWVFHVIRDYARTLKSSNSRFIDKLAEFKKMSSALELVQLPQPIVFTHNDLLAANFMDDGDKQWLIDFEYAAFGTPMFDLANLASNADFNEDQDRQLLKHYYKFPPSDELLRSLEAMKCASLLRETMWSMVSEIHLNAPGVDYGQYVKDCLPAFYTELEKYQMKYGKIT